MNEWNRLRSRASGLSGGSAGFAGLDFFAAGFFAASAAVSLLCSASMLTDTEDGADPDTAASDGNCGAASGWPFSSPVAGGAGGGVSGVCSTPIGAFKCGCTTSEPGALSAGAFVTLGSLTGASGVAERSVRGGGSIGGGPAAGSRGAPSEGATGTALLLAGT